MSRLVRKHSPFFKLLLTTTSKLQRKVLLDSITNDQLRALTEVTVNLLQGVLPVTPDHRQKLKKYRRLIRLIGDKKVSLKTKKKALCRQSGVIALMLKSIEPALNKVLS
jgi:hypothetical protein